MPVSTECAAALLSFRYPSLLNLTSAWPVMLLANQRLPDRNQILAGVMSLLKSVLGKRKFLSTSMFRWRFQKKKFKICFFCDEILLAGAAVRLFNSLQIIKNLLVKARGLHSMLKVVKNNLGWGTIFHELKSAVKAKIAQNNSQVS